MACSIVPQPTALLHDPYWLREPLFTFILFCNVIVMAVTGGEAVKIVLVLN